MMFSKYVSKITNTIGTINYLQHKSSTNNEQQLYLQNSPRDDDGKETNNNSINSDLSSKRSQILIDNCTIESKIILTAAIAKLRNTFFAYELV